MLELAAEVYSEQDKMGFLSAVATMTRAVDRCANDLAIQERAWAILRNYASVVRTSSEYAFRCNTKVTVTDYVHWLLTEETSKKPDGFVYIMLSRLSELTKPQQLAGWEEVDSDDFKAFLQPHATHNTKITGIYATTSRAQKNYAWETALTIGCPDAADWIDAAVLDETNPYVSWDVSRIVASLRVDHLPQRLLDCIVNEELHRDDAKGHLCRQMGLIEIASSSCSRAAFESLLHFGLTNEGNVLLSTIDAIFDVAIVRIQEGDADIIERLLEMTTRENQRRHREASISVFCKLCREELVPKHLLKHLPEFITAEDLDLYSRREALEAIGLTSFEEALQWEDSIRQLAASDNGELGWRAWEVLIRRGWLTDSDEALLFDRLGLVEIDGRLRVVAATKIDGWPAFLAGLLFRSDAERYSSVVSDILLQSRSDVVCQIFDSLRHLGSRCPELVTNAMYRRIQESNNQSSTDTEFFQVLADISPARLLKFGKDGKSRDWLLEARTALCEAIRSVAIQDEQFRAEAVSCLVSFLGDPALQVRRSAYRAIAGADVNELEKACEQWSRFEDIELRKRAAEAVAWLPIANYPDEDVSALGFAWDVEPSVRNVWKDVLSTRRQRQWADSYLDRVLSTCKDFHTSTLPSYRFARALTKIGDDETVRRIDDFLKENRTLWPNIRHWLKRTRDDIWKNWKKTTEKWKEPWSHEEGKIEVLNGDLIRADGSRTAARLSLWCRYSSGPSGLGDWGGIAEELEVPLSSEFDEGRIELRIPGRETAHVNVFGSHWSSSSRSRLVVRGDSLYPEPSREPALYWSVSDFVAEILLDSGLQLPAGGAGGITQSLKPLLDRSEVSLLRLAQVVDTDVQKKIACQLAMPAMCVLAKSLPPSFQTSITLWRVADCILQRANFTFSLSPPELEQFGDILRSGEADSSERNLEWLVDRIADRQQSIDTDRQVRAAKEK